jgi:hypothetical protein
MILKDEFCHEVQQIGACFEMDREMLITSGESKIARDLTLTSTVN